MYRRILLPTDGSTLSDRAVREGVKLAKSIGAQIVGFHAVPPYPAGYFGEPMPVAPLPPEIYDRNAEKTAERFLARIERAAHAAGVPCRTTWTTDDRPAQAIVAAAKSNRCDMIFMGAHGRTGIARLLLGSQTWKVLSMSKIPVLVYRAPES